MKGHLADEVRIKHILDAITEVEHYLTGITLSDFLNNSEKRFACIKQLEIIGEACSKISESLKLAYPEIRWREIIAFRNISIHEYFGVNFQIVWEIAKYDLPVLKNQFLGILKN